MVNPLLNSVIDDSWILFICCFFKLFFGTAIIYWETVFEREILLFYGEVNLYFQHGLYFFLTNVYKSKCFIYFAIAFIGNEGPYKVTVVLPTQRLFQCISMGQMDQDQNNFTKEDQIKDNLLYSNKL